VLGHATYLFDRVLASIFDFLMNVHTPQLEFLEGTGWKGYDGHDMADDGVSRIAMWAIIGPLTKWPSTKSVLA
jgi:hypothetical protein